MIFTRKKRYSHNITSWDLPKKNEKSIYVGRIANSKYKAFLNLNEFSMHAIIAGSTGAGKTITAQVIAEEALMKGIAVAVIDPTVQWTGFLNKLEDNSLKKRYDLFGMRKTDSRGFPTRIIFLEKDSNYINIISALKPGEITIFLANRLTEKELDEFITMFIKSFFESSSDESQNLKTILMFEEIHRILPKYGGSGKGLIAIERAVREFRKWGIGLILISQVLEDFVGEIRANIGNEIQMRTGYEVDLAKISLKYGDKIVKDVVKEKVGTGMIHNSNFNIGQPYFVRFRPPYHSAMRCSNDELIKYKKIANKIKSKVSLEKTQELKLAEKKLLRGDYTMANEYLNRIVKVDKDD